MNHHITLQPVLKLTENVNLSGAKDTAADAVAVSICGWQKLRGCLMVAFGMLVGPADLGERGRRRAPAAAASRLEAIAAQLEKRAMGSRR